MDDSSLIAVILSVNNGDSPPIVALQTLGSPQVGTVIRSFDCPPPLVCHRGPPLKAPNAPIGNPSNHWEMLAVSHPNVTAYPPIPTKLFPNEFTIILTHPLRGQFPSLRQRHPPATASSSNGILWKTAFAFSDPPAEEVETFRYRAIGHRVGKYGND